MSNQIPQEAMLTFREVEAVSRRVAHLTTDLAADVEDVLHAAAEKAYRVACLEVACDKCSGTGAAGRKIDPLRHYTCDHCRGDGKRLLTAADVARELRALAGVMDAEGNGRWFKSHAVAYLTRMQLNLREQAAKANPIIAALDKKEVK